MMIWTKWRLVFAFVAIAAAACSAKTPEQNNGNTSAKTAVAQAASTTSNAGAGIEAHANVEASSIPTTVELPREVNAFIERRGLCDHFRGEEPYDQERKAFLDQKLEETCKGTDAALKSIRQRYRDNQAVISALWDYDSVVE